MQVRPESGVRKGDPLSPALFAPICSLLVPMLLLLRQSPPTYAHCFMLMTHCSR